VTRRSWNAMRSRALRHSRGTERANKNQPFMLPLLARNTRPRLPSKDEMREETARLLAEFSADRRS
jgi:hypothetical protein